MSEYFLNALNASWAMLQYVFVVYAGGLLLERVLPVERRQPWRDIVFNLWWTVLFTVLVHLSVPPLQGVIRPVVAGYGGLLSLRLPEGFGWQIAQGFLFALVFDFFYYWFHRAQHMLPWLWVQHRLHHSERSLNVTSGNRHHWLEEPMRVFLIFLPMGVLFDLPPSSIAWFWSTLLLWGFFIHLNLRLPLGPLTPVFAGPQLHRIHHSVERQHQDRNFAAFFPIWDILFGTYWAPRKGEYPATGLHDGEDLNGFWRASFSPFRDWWRMARRDGAQKSFSDA